MTPRVPRWLALGRRRTYPAAARWHKSQRPGAVIIAPLPRTEPPHVHGPERRRSRRAERWPTIADVGWLKPRPSTASSICWTTRRIPSAANAWPATSPRRPGWSTVRGERVLLTHHRKLDRWLQLGGHADGERDFARVALTRSRRGIGADGPDRRRRRSSTSTRTRSPSTRACPRTCITTCASSCAREGAKRSSSATNRTRWRGARSRRCRTTTRWIRRCGGWRRSGWRS